MTKAQDIFGSATGPSVLNKPFFHAQDRKSNGTNGGASVAGYQTRTLNTVQTNEISGASLSSNTITLPAGEYWVECETPHYYSERSKTELQNGSGDVLLSSASHYGPSGSSVVNFIRGRLVLNESTSFTIEHYTKLANALGLGIAGDNSSATTSNEIYTDIRIWQLDSYTRTPVLINDKLYPLPGNTIVTGNMHGLNYAKTDDNEVTIQPGICMDSTNTEVLTLSSQSAISITC